MKPLTTLQASWLQGRAADIEEITANCSAERMTVVTADPGAGITSLFLAGLVPALRQLGFIPVYYTGWQGRYFPTEFKEAIAQAVREQADESFYAEPELIFEMLDRVRLRTGRTVILLLDDFHDYLRAHVNSDVANSFDAEIAQVLSGREGRTVLGIHESALPQLERLRPHVPNLLSYRHLLPLLSAEAARAMVVTRAEAAGMTVEDEAVSLLLGAPRISTFAGCHPYYLSVALERCVGFETVLKSTCLRAATLKANGGVTVILNEFFDHTIEEMNAGHKDLFFRLCNILIPHGKPDVTVSEKRIMEYAGRMNRFVLTLMPQVTQKAILRPFDINGELHYELTREANSPLLRDWWERSEAKIVARKRAVFRITSISLAVGAIVLVYIIYLFAK